MLFKVLNTKYIRKNKNFLKNYVKSLDKHTEWEGKIEIVYRNLPKMFGLR